MTTRRSVRALSGYHEVDSDFAVARDLADSIIGASARIVSRYTGPITLTLNGIRIPPLENPISIVRVKPPGQHAALITKRSIDPQGGLNNEPGKFAPGISRTPVGNDIAESRLFIQAQPSSRDPIGASMLETGIHEMGHTWGLGHCSVAACIMQAESERNPTALQAKLSSPFCDSCAGDLEIAGYLAVAKQL